MTKKLKREENPRTLTPFLRSIVILDGGGHQLDAVRTAFRAACPEAEIASVSSEAALHERLANSAPDLVLLDQDLGDGHSNGLVILRSMREAHPELPIVVVAETGDVETARRAVEAGATDFLVRQQQLDERITTQLQKIRALVSLIEKNRALGRENLSLRSQVTASPMVGESAQIRRVIETMERVAKVPRPVLVVGERGTGKELVARAIHALSGCRGAFVVVNAAGLNDNLLDSELFGHERGAFTGAERLTRGKFEIASGGTLFLDEIGSMPLAFQKKILRVVEYGTFLRVGGGSEVAVETRIIAATNADLKAKIEAGEFLADLYDRLAFEVIEVPPLRERPEDIPILARHFLERFMLEVPAFAGKRLAPDALRVLSEYAFPGNIRELKNIIERAVYRETSDELTLEDIELPRDVVVPSAGNFKQRLEALEHDLVEQALEEAGGNQTQAARSLGLSYAQFRYYLSKHAR
jgi:DNA-binding NtrC family response regulator